MRSIDAARRQGSGRVRPVLALALVGGAAVLASGGAAAGRFIFDEVTYAEGYTGSAASLTASVCWAAGSDPKLMKTAERSVRNAVARWNRLQPASANLRDGAIGFNQVDFESVIVHELGHCLGLGHPNLGAVVAGGAVNATAARRGPNNVYDTAAGADGIHGTADDIRSDDTSIHYFRRSNNNPFTLADSVDASSYSTDPAQLPAGDLFPSNAERQVGTMLGTPFTEAVMQHDIFAGQLNRNLGHDDVATLRYAMSGLDERAGSADDYRLEVEYTAEATGDCDITLGFSNTRTAAASCRITGFREPGSLAVIISSGEILINDQVDWFYNQTPPCTMRQELPANRWTLFSLPCDVGVSTSRRVRDVLADDLGEARIDERWVLYAYEYARGADGLLRPAYRALALDDELDYGRGYWLIDLDGGRTIDVQGEYPVQVDQPLAVDALQGQSWNLVGNPFRFASRWPDARIVDGSGRVLALDEADPPLDGVRACGTAAQHAACTVHATAFRWDSAAESYVALSPEAGTIGPFEGAWVKAAQPGALLRLVMPRVERITR